ncbi:ATP-binding protein [Leucobacter massiliensis]|uniref:Histidine kinase/HSP90-like ATPase domain-containing protein n=1 Tax=Leucobacter massiliensis TaxID=1686285 RepID=A0A2S9QL97_9MICO|nr:ATP-binding protein [Leucobacter massiliensis]PRI10366.1 hypothetical protein B4915_11965 [Leucobacter massiliensis]
MGAERTEPRVLRLRGAAELSFVDRALDALDGLWAASPELPARERTLFALAVAETLTNIVEHGSGGGAARAGSGEPEVEIRLSVELDLGAVPRELRATIRDSAAPAAIDWGSVAMPGGEAESGRGLALARSVLDEFRHEPAAASAPGAEAPRGNTWVLGKRLGPEPDSAGDPGS